MLGSRPRRRFAPRTLAASIESLEDRTLLSGSGLGAVIGQAMIVDNGDAGFSVSGSGWGISVNGGHAGDHHYNAAGTGADTAQWTFNVTPGVYHVSTTWLEGLNRATNSPFTVLDGTTELATLTLNQELAPDDFTADGAAWKSLGQFSISSGTLIVRLSDAANEWVAADAVRIAQVQTGPEIDVTVDGNNVVDGGSVHFGETLVGSAVSKTVTVTNSGDSDLLLIEPTSMPNGFSLERPFGATTLAAGESTTFVIRLDASVVGSFSGGVSFGSNDMDESPFNVTISGAVVDSLIIDNGDAGFSVNGADWGVSVNGGYAGDHHYNAAGTGSDTAEWTFNVAPGAYQVSATWLEGLNRATNAPFTILDGTTELATVTLNQELAPDDFTANGAAWEILGQFNINSGTLTVRLSDASNEWIAADAIRIAPVAPIVPEVSTDSGTTTFGTGDGGTGDSGAGDEDTRDGCRRFWGFRRGRDFTPPARGRVIRNVVLPIIRDWFDSRPAESSLGQKIAAAVRSLGNGRGRC